MGTRIETTDLARDALYTKVNQIADEKANVELDNLSGTGQMIIDTVDGKISNCILEIPQNIKLTLENNVVTLKAGSTVLRGGEVYNTYTLTEDKSLTISSSLENGRYFLYTNNTGTPMMTIQNKFGSGTTLPADSSVYGRFFITTNKTFYNWSSAQNAWVESGVSYPIAMIDVVNGVASFAKDSNGNDMIFNGAGFIGHHAFVYPNVNGLQSDGINNGVLSSNLLSLTTLSIIEFNSGRNSIFAYSSTSIATRNYVGEYNTVSEAPTTITSGIPIAYIKSENKHYQFANSQWSTSTSQRRGLLLLTYAYDGSTVTKFDICQPVRLATTEMTDKIQSQVDTNTTAISGKQDTLVSGTNIKTINSTNVLGSGNFALANQSLSNLSADGQMIIDSQNGTISNCILEIPQNLKCEISNGTLTLKAGSKVAIPASVYTELTIAQDLTISGQGGSTNKFVVCVKLDGSTLYARLLSNSVSGPNATTNGGFAYDTTTNEIWYCLSDGTKAQKTSYPICVVQQTNGTITGFVQDSNGNDMIFNGAGFIGHHAFVYPNVKGLRAFGFYEDKTLKSQAQKTTALQLYELPNNRPETYLYLGAANDLVMGATVAMGYPKYVAKENWCYCNTSSISSFLPIVRFATDSNRIVTDFTIRQPVRTATTENSYTKEQVDTKLASKQDTLVSGTNIKTINSTNVLGSGNFALADQSLSNLNSDGQMIIDSQNGTISNCVLEIPQNLKLEISGDTFTIKSGSTIVLVGATYTTYTLTSDTIVDYSTNLPNVSDGLYYIFANSNGTVTRSAWIKITNCFSGTPLPNASDYPNSSVFFETSEKKKWYNNNGTWMDLGGSYPLGLFEVKNHQLSFAKDSNGNDMIFNGAGFIGHHAFVYPNVRKLICNGKADGKLNSYDELVNGLYIVDLGQSVGTRAVISRNGNTYFSNIYWEIDKYSDLVAQSGVQYCRETNYCYSYVNGIFNEQSRLALAYITHDGTTVTDFTIRQPVRMATVEMLDSATTKAKIYKGTYDSTVQYYEGDIVKSGTEFFEALQDNINVATSNTTNWSKLSNDNVVRYYEKNDDVEYPIGLATSNASGTGYKGNLFFTTQNKPTINASTGVITATGGVVGKTETAGDNSTKYASTAFVQTELANKFQVVTTLPANPDANTFYFIVEEDENESEGE